MRRQRTVFENSKLTGKKSNKVRKKGKDLPVLNQRNKNRNKKLREDKNEMTSATTFFNYDIQNIHNFGYENDGYSSISSSGKSEFDEEYYMCCPKPIRLSERQIVTIGNVMTTQNKEEIHTLHKLEIYSKIETNRRFISSPNLHPSSNTNGYKENWDNSVSHKESSKEFPKSGKYNYSTQHIVSSISPDVFALTTSNIVKNRNDTSENGSIRNNTHIRKNVNDDSAIVTKNNKRLPKTLKQSIEQTNNDNNVPTLLHGITSKIPDIPRLSPSNSLKKVTLQKFHPASIKNRNEKKCEKNSLSHIESNNEISNTHYCIKGQIYVDRYNSSSQNTVSSKIPDICGMRSSNIVDKMNDTMENNCIWNTIQTRNNFKKDASRRVTEDNNRLPQSQMKVVRQTNNDNYIPTSSHRSTSEIPDIPRLRPFNNFETLSNSSENRTSQNTNHNRSVKRPTKDCSILVAETNTSSGKEMCSTTYRGCSQYGSRSKIPEVSGIRPSNILKKSFSTAENYNDHISVATTSSVLPNEEYVRESVSLMESDRTICQKICEIFCCARSICK